MKNPYLRYLMVSAAAVGLTLGAYALFVRSGLGVSVGAQNVHVMYQAKTEIAEVLSSPKIVLIGGSSVAFGIRAETLENETLIPTVNYGVHAGMLLEYTLYRARAVLKPGDIALLALEHQHFDYDGAPNRLVAEYAVSYDPEYMQDLPWRSWFRHLLGVSIERRLLTLVMPEAREEAWGLNDRGDTTTNDPPRPRGATRRLRREAQQPLPDIRLSGAAMTEIERFAKWCRDRQIRVFATYAPALIDRATGAAEAEAFAEPVRLAYERADVPLLEEPTDLLLSIESFYDTRYHLTGNAAATRTRALARRLQHALADPRNVGTFPQEPYNLGAPELAVHEQRAFAPRSHAHRLELTRLSGHLKACAEEVHDADYTAAVSAGVPAADHRAGQSRENAR